MIFCRMLLAGFVTLALGNLASAQSVGLPAPRLLTTMPMGGKVGTTFPVTITGESLDGKLELLFTDPRITAVPETGANGEIQPNRFLVTIAPDASPGLYEARVMSRLGVSASRIFAVSALPEATRTQSNTSLETAMSVPLNSVVNATTTTRAIDYYKITCDQKTRLVVECAAAGIDSHLKPVLMIADEKGRDLIADRRNGFLDFTLPAAGTYIIKVHGLTFEGGPQAFYRLIVQTLAPGVNAARAPAFTAVNAISLPAAIALPASTVEAEPNHGGDAVQKISLPCDVSGLFYPAADVDTFEFTAKKGEVWWVEVVSERLGLPTNPFALVQQVKREAGQEQRVDVAEFNDVPSPVRLSTNGYSYNGPFYDTGTQDALGKLEIKEDGIYQLQLRDLFGGTRRDPRCVYRLIIRQAAPDFALATWALHMELRNGDRNVLSKPIALRQGATMIFEVVAFRKDGFDGLIDITVEGLPPGLSAAGLQIPAGKSQGTLIITAAADAQTAVGYPTILGRAEINGAAVTRESRLASVAWPSVNANMEIPMPRLVADIAASVSAEEAAPLTIAPVSQEPVVVAAGSKVTIPLNLTWRGEYSGALKLIPTGNEFARVKPLDITMGSATAEIALDLNELELPVGDHTFAMYGGLVTNYRYNEAAVRQATADVQAATAEIEQLTKAQQEAAAAVAAAIDEAKAAADVASKEAAARLQTAQANKAAAEKRLAAATAAAAPREIVDIVVTEPIRLRVTDAESK